VSYRNLYEADLRLAFKENDMFAGSDEHDD
jgi:hypothetical protein